MADDLDAFYAEIATVEAQVVQKDEPAQGPPETLPLSNPLPPPPCPPPTSAATASARPQLPPPPHPPNHHASAVISQRPVISAAPQPAAELAEETAAPPQHAAEPGGGGAWASPLQAQPGPSNPYAPQAQAPPSDGGPGNKKVGIIRQAAGTRWIDTSLAEWPDNDFRIFVGNLGPEVSDQMLVQAFNKYESFTRAKVVRANHNKKSRGYGFVSLSDIQEGAKCLREMHNQYIGNRPCQLKRAVVENRSVTDQKGRIKKRMVEERVPKERKQPRHDHNDRQGGGGGYSYGGGGGGRGGGGYSGQGRGGQGNFR